MVAKDHRGSVFFTAAHVELLVRIVYIVVTLS